MSVVVSALIDDGGSRHERGRRAGRERDRPARRGRSCASRAPTCTGPAGQGQLVAEYAITCEWLQKRGLRLLEFGRHVEMLAPPTDRLSRALPSSRGHGVAVHSMTMRDDQLSDVLGEFARTMLTDFPVIRILEHLVKRIVEILPITAAGVTLISATRGPHHVAASDESALRYEKLQTELDDGPCLEAYRTGQAVSVPNLHNESRFGAFAPRAVEAGLVAVFTFPLRHRSESLGALDLYCDTPGELNADDMASAQTLADVTSAYLVNAEARRALEELSARSHASATHDPLTGLANRVLLLERLGHALQRAQRSHGLLALLFVDLDRFKRVNDLHGHRAGDDVLVAVARRIAGLLRPGDTLARISGDEFVVLCEDLEDGVQAEKIAARIVVAIGRPFLVGADMIELGASVGVASVRRGASAPEDVLGDADAAMYKVKRDGGSGHRHAVARELVPGGSEADVRRALEGAMSRDEFRIEYQPVVRARDGLVVGAEALLRWDPRDPALGVVAPSTVVELAEQSGSIIEIGWWALERACADRWGWAEPGGADGFVVAVNVSPRQLVAPGFAARVAAILAETRTPARLVSLEITETVLLGDADRALAVLADLKEIGVLLALDDFGTGYSSLSYLNRFPVDVLKLDQSFVADIAHDRSSHAIVKKLIELAHMLDIAVVTEGVETLEQRDAVAALGSEFCQGFYFARPMPAAGFDELMATARAGGRRQLPVAANA